MGNEQPVTILLNPARLTVQPGVTHRQPQRRRCPLGNPTIMTVNLSVAPAVETDVLHGTLAQVVDRHNRPGIPAPEVLCRNVPKGHVFADKPPDTPVMLGVCHKNNWLETGNGIRHIRNRALNMAQKPSIVIDLAADRPLHERQFVGLFFGRHNERRHGSGIQCNARKWHGAKPRQCLPACEHHPRTEKLDSSLISRLRE